MENYRIEKPSQVIHEREQYVAKTFLKLGMKDKLEDRWKEIGYSPEPIQLKLF
jgi:hypothetical protein